MRTEADLAAYQWAFHAIDTDSAQLLVAAEADAEIVATFQLSFLPGLARRGALRAQIEAVRVRDDYRGRRLGEALMTWAIDEARRAAAPWCSSPVTSPGRPRTASTPGSGFVASHEGMKLRL